MEKQLIISLLNVYHSENMRFGQGKSLFAFCQEYHLGRFEGKSIYFSAKDKQDIAALLWSEGIDINTTYAESFRDKTRAKTLQIANNEKLNTVSARLHRVALKTFYGKPLLWQHQASSFLPLHAHLEIDYQQTAHLLAHETVIVVENWESFNQIDDMSLDFSPAGDNPLIIWRGEQEGVRADNALALLKKLHKPVWACVDYDPSGLIIAQSLPCFVGMIKPDLTELREILSNNKGLYSRYLKQLNHSQSSLDAAIHPDIVQLWHMIREFGKAVAQEFFIKKQKTPKTKALNMLLL